MRDLARLSLSNPHFISVHETSEFSTPAGLVQSYMICELHDKMSLLWSFIKNHLHHKVLVFMSSCKQVIDLINSCYKIAFCFICCDIFRLNISMKFCVNLDQEQVY